MLLNVWKSMFNSIWIDTIFQVDYLSELVILQVRNDVAFVGGSRF